MLTSFAITTRGNGMLVANYISLLQDLKKPKNKVQIILFKPE